MATATLGTFAFWGDQVTGSLTWDPNTGELVSMTFQSSADRDVTVTLTITGQDPISFPIPAVTPLTTMPIDSPPITLPLDGDWSISVSGRRLSGVSSPPRGAAFR